jgi:polyribonucleotide nucleotidyltransferase
MFEITTQSVALPDGREITIETGKLARQADGAVVVRLGDTMLLATVVSSKDAKEGVDFLPLSVDYQEKFASSGRIPGSFQRREGRLGDHEILISRLVDRALRPIFPNDYHADTQVMITLISADPEVQPDALAALAASSAIAVSNIPFNGPISEVRVAKIDGQYKINPKTSELERATLDLIVAATEKDICMVEGEMSECQEAEMLEALKIAHEAIKVQCQAQKQLEAKVGKTEKRQYSHETHDEELRAAVRAYCYDRIYEVARRQNPSKKGRSDDFKAVRDEFIATFPEGSGVNVGLIKTYFHDLQSEASRRLVLDERARLDGRALDQIRPISAEAGYLPGPHGSALFTRGETQSLTTVTLGTKTDEQIVDQTMYQGYSKFLLHYNFPGFSTGEVKPNRGAGRREIGHGNLAHRSLKKVLPAGEDNPYTIRIVSDILESNGSSSMATVCAGTMALMDAGIKIKAPVAGIAMGLISDAPSDGGTKYAVLSDILGDEDHLGDMDFKVTGTENGIVACQMDLKVEGLSYEVLAQALEQARVGRLHILGEMKKGISEVRSDLKPHAPRAVVIRIDTNQIGAVIGPGGKVVQDIQKDSGAVVNIDEHDNAGWVSIFATSKESMDKAVSRVKGIVALPEVGEVYVGKVKTIQPFGAFVEFMPGKDGLLHISEIKWERLEAMDGVLQVGEEITVKLVDVDKKTGKYRLSRKVLLPKPENKTA